MGLPSSPTRDDDADLLVPGLVVGLLAALWMLYPAWLSPGHVLVGDWRHPDTLSNHWLYAWVSDQVLAGATILHNDRYYVPVGDQPWLAGNGGDAIPAAPVLGLLGWPAGVVAWLFLTFVADGLAAYLLCRRCGAGGGGATFGAFVVATSPLLSHELSGGRFNQAPVWCLCAFLWAFLGILRDGRRRWAVASAVLFAWTCLVYWYWGLWAAILAFGLLCAWAGSHRGLLGRRWRPLAGAGVGAGLLVAPLLAVFLVNWARIPGVDEPVSPHPLALASALPVLFPFWSGGAERAEVVLPILALGLAVFGCGGRERWLTWGLVGLGTLFYLLSLGPAIAWVGGQETGLVGPFALFYRGLPALERFWWPYRHALGLTLVVAVLSARGLDRLLPRLPAWISTYLPWILACILPFDTASRGARLGPAVSWWEPPAAYVELGRLPGDGVIELPLAPDLVTGQQSLTYQLLHGKRLVNGHAMWVDRVRPRAWDAWVASNGFLSLLQTWERGRLDGPFAFRPADVEALRADGVQYLVVNAEYFPGALQGLVERYPVIFDALFGAPVYAWGDEVRVWDLEGFQWTGWAEAPPFALPAGYGKADGTHMLDLGHNRSLGLRGLTRAFPPRLPPDGPSPGHPDGGAQPASVPSTVPAGGAP